MGELSLQVVHHAPGITAGCKTCRTILAMGDYMIGITIDGTKYVIGHKPPLTCCNEKKRVPWLFTELPAAETAIEEADPLLQSGGTSRFELIRLSEFTQGPMQ